MRAASRGGQWGSGGGRAPCGGGWAQGWAGLNVQLCSRALDALRPVANGMLPSSHDPTSAAAPPTHPWHPHSTSPPAV